MHQPPQAPRTLMMPYTKAHLRVLASASRSAEEKTTLDSPNVGSCRGLVEKGTAAAASRMHGPDEEPERSTREQSTGITLFRHRCTLDGGV